MDGKTSTLPEIQVVIEDPWKMVNVLRKENQDLKKENQDLKKENGKLKKRLHEDVEGQKQIKKSKRSKKCG